jgi:hypothetical protein
MTMKIYDFMLTMIAITISFVAFGALILMVLKELNK